MTIIQNYKSYNTFRAADGTPLQDASAMITKPIDKVENIVTKTVDTFVPESKDEEKKKSHKTAIRVGSTVLVLGAFVALFNPKFSSSLLDKIKTASTKAGNKAKVDNSLSGTWNKFKQKFMEYIYNAMRLLSNGNNAKDEGFKYICSKTKFLKKPHDAITRVFDKISKHTVYSKYAKATANLNKTEKLMELYREKLNSEEIKLLDTKLAEIKNLKEYFSKTNTTNRLQAQENLMSDLENKWRKRFKDFVLGFKDKNNRNTEHAKEVCNFWSQDILMPKRNKIEADGLDAVNKLFGDGKSLKGKYDEVLEIISPHLNQEELKALNEQLKYSAKKLRSANKSECIEYFDKKRDLMLGSAPTDIITALLGLVGSGIAIGTADTKEDKISRSVSGVFPAIAGLGVNTALTSMLFSGAQSIMLASAASSVLSLIGSTVNRLLFPKQTKSNSELKNV